MPKLTASQQAVYDLLPKGADHPLNRQASTEMAVVNTLIQIDLNDFWTKEKAND